MQSMMHRWETKSRRVTQSRLVSATIHLLVIGGLAWTVPHTVKIAPYRLPGTKEGIRFLTYYSSGSPARPASDVATAKVPEKTSASVLHSPKATPKPAQPQAPAAENGVGTASLSGHGEGDISIALQTFFPYPKPSLATLPRGSHGDVILNAVIDEKGKISELTLVQGLGQAIDDVVIATVRQWSYTPAKKNGVPIPSEQELHFHYERG